jgi:hypothetical protein
MNKQIKHPMMNKGRRKLSLYFVSCWLNLHSWQNIETAECDLTQGDAKKGECNMTLYRCTKCGKEKLVATEIQTACS